MSACGYDECEAKPEFWLSDTDEGACRRHLAVLVARVLEERGIAVVDVERAPHSGAEIVALAAQAPARKGVGPGAAGWS